MLDDLRALPEWQARTVQTLSLQYYQICRRSVEYDLQNRSGSHSPTRNVV